MWLLAVTSLVGCASMASAKMGGDQAHWDAPAATAERRYALNEPSGADGDNAGTSAPAAPKADPARAKRVMIYTATLRVVVLDITSSQKDIERIAVERGGFLQSLLGDAVTIKVPAAKFRETIDELSKLGDVTDQQVRGLDVTDQLRDLNIRLANAERTRERLLAILEKATKVEDTLKIEKELQRVTETIELIKGKLRLLSDQIAYSTITVRLNSPLPRRQLVVQVPFEWVRDLGADFIKGTRPANISTGFFRSGIDCKMPEGFIKYYESRTHTRAMSAEGVLVKLAEQTNYKGGTLDFWTKLVKRSLQESRAIKLNRDERGKLNDGKAVAILSGEKVIGGKKQGYLVAIINTKNYVYAYEAWGPSEAFGQELLKLIGSVKTLDPRW